MSSDSISLEATVAMAGISKRTLWRRIASGTIRKLPEDSRGRAMLSFADAVVLMDTPMDDDHRKMLLSADDGDAEAQVDMGAMLHIAGAFDASVYWFKQAASQQNADAMQWLGRCYASGIGVSQNTYLAIKWLAQSAALGHLIAQHQLASLIHCPQERLKHFDARTGDFVT